MSARVLVVGEALIDIVRRQDGTETEYPGGSPANVALTLGRRKVSSELLTCIGDDDRGTAIRDWLDVSGVTVVEGAAPKTSTAVATIAADGSASYDFDITWEPSGTPGSGHELVHTGSIAGYLEPGAATVRDLIADRRSTALVTYDPNVRPSLIAEREPVVERILALVALADVVKVSDEDLQWLEPGVNPADVAGRWLTLGPRLVIVTAGGDGVAAYTPTTRQHVPSVTVEVADTICAGDSFMGATIDWLLSYGFGGAAGRARLNDLDDDLVNLLDYAAATAAITVSRPGADPPWAAELG